MNKQTISRRIRLIRSRMAKDNIDCLILTNPANVTYVTCFSGDDTWAAVTKSTVYLITDSRYTEQANKECLLCRIIERTKPIAQATAGLLNKVRSARIIAVENSSAISVFEALKKHCNARVRSSADRIEQLRSVKDDTEIDAIKTAVSIATQALHDTLPLVQPGITENEVAGLLNLQFRRLGATISFDTIVAFGPNASRPHHQPGSTKLKDSDTLLIDFGAKYKGYCSDITRCFAIGQATFLYRKAYDVVEKAQRAAIDTVRAGADMIKVDAIARQVIQDSNLPVYGHGTGHGFGLQIHELPTINEQSKGKLIAGQVVTIEPGIYMPGKLGIRLEEDVLVTETGCELLTGDCPHTLILPNQKP
jgi:Xaa-Pro aminopeptidase